MLNLKDVLTFRWRYLQAVRHMHLRLKVKVWDWETNGEDTNDIKTYECIEQGRCTRRYRAYSAIMRTTVSSSLPMKRRRMALSSQCWRRPSSRIPGGCWPLTQVESLRSRFIERFSLNKTRWGGWGINKSSDSPCPPHACIHTWIYTCHVSPPTYNKYHTHTP